MNKHALFFNTAKWIALVLALCALLGSLYSLVVTLRSFGPGSFNVPEFDAQTYIREQQRFNAPLSANDPQVQQERLEITKKYGDRILAVITNRALSKIKVDDIVDFMQEHIPTERQSDFVSGWDAYLNQGMGFLQENNRLTNTAGEELNSFFQLAFLNSLRESNNEASQFKHERVIYMSAAVLLAILFVMAMIVPFLAAIELNTRAGKSLAPAAPPVTSDNGLCGEGGARQDDAA